MDTTQGVTCPGTLIVASNRQPYRHEFSDESPDGFENESDEITAYSEEESVRQKITIDEPTGGLTAGLDPVLRHTGGTWIAWGDGDADRIVTDEDNCVSVPPDEESYTLRRIWLSEEELESYYYGFSNRVLWPICHELPDTVEYREGDFDGYRDVNRQFATAIADRATDDSIIWLQDYHLGLAPSMIRNAVPRSATVGQFWHIPWPRPTVFESCPHGEEVIEGLLGNDLLGFHVDRFREAFFDCVERFCPSTTVDRSRNTVFDGSDRTRVVASPMGIDADAYDQQSRSVDTNNWAELRNEFGIPPNVSIGLGVDRLDYSKGIPERLLALERLFERYPDWRESFTFVQKATPSRTDIEAYAEHGSTVRSLVDRINDRFASDSWQPIVYTETYVSRENLCALYRHADLLIVSSILDGMNLVAQEYVASCVESDGALVLSTNTGAHDVLGEHAFSIEPDRTDHFASVIHSALTTSQAERLHRMGWLRNCVFDNDIESWMGTQFDEIAAEHDRQPPSEIESVHGSHSVR